MPRKHVIATLKRIIVRHVTDPAWRKHCLAALLLFGLLLIIPRTIHHVPAPIHPMFQPKPAALQPSIFDPFPFPDALKPQVEFWKKIFTEYTSQQAIIHDDWYVTVVYEVVDLARAKYATDEEKWKAVKDVQDKYVRLLDNLSQHWDKPHEMTDTERQVSALFRNIPETPRVKKRDAKDRVRAQVGQADHVKSGLIRAGRYLAAMKDIMAEYDLPENIVYLPLIESMFNTEAESYLSAAGMWQFMRRTGKEYNLTIHATVDERKDPLRSTHAAAQVLAHNYKVAQSWPLAITAYNHGLQGIKNAANAVGSTDIADIIAQYDGPRFGFASRNFYPEFLAALDVALRANEYFGELDVEDPIQLAQLPLRDYVSANTIEKYGPLKKAELKRLNPALADAVFDPGNYLPKGYHLNIPLAQKAAFETAYASIPASLKYHYLPVKAQHKLEKGQTLGLLAKRYNTTVKAILKLNNLSNPRKVRIGQIIKIPGGYVSTTPDHEAESPQVVAAAASKSKTKVSQTAAALPSKSKPDPSPAVKNAKVHEVESGQSLFTIAKKYRTTVDAIVQANRLTNPRQIRVGQDLSIPEAHLSAARNEQAATSKQPPVKVRKMEHRVEKGQTLGDIAKKYKTSVKAISQFNAIKNPRMIKPGQLLKIPKG